VYTSLVVRRRRATHVITAPVTAQTTVAQYQAIARRRHDAHANTQRLPGNVGIDTFNRANGALGSSWTEPLAVIASIPIGSISEQAMTSIGTVLLLEPIKKYSSPSPLLTPRAARWTCC
jgi:hypothetical protein